MIIREKNRLLSIAFATACLAASTSDLRAHAQMPSDDTQKLQQLILQHQGGAAFLGSQTYVVSATIFIPSNTKVVGMNQDTTIVKAAPGFLGTIFSFGTPVKHGPSSNASLSQLSVDGNAKGFPSDLCNVGPAIFVPPGSKMIELANLEVRNDSVNGIGLHGMGSSPQKYAAYVHDCYVHDNYANGINISGAVPVKVVCIGLPSGNSIATPTLYNIVERNTLSDNDKADAGSTTKRFHGINVSELACFTTVAGNTVTRDDINVGDSGQYDSYLSGFVQPPLIVQGNRILNNTIWNAPLPSGGGTFDGIRVNGFEFRTQVDGNQG